jgi:hypothetical protein
MPTQTGPKLIRMLRQFEQLSDIPAGGKPAREFCRRSRGTGPVGSGLRKSAGRGGVFELAFWDGAGKEAMGTVELTVEGKQRVLEPVL